MSHESFSARPLELVRYSSEDGKFIVGKEAIDVLRGVHAPLGVVAVCGRARQGKSYILNRLLKQTDRGFVVGPTHRPCTKGLWMWSEPQPRTNPDGSKSYLVLLDTEGIDAWDQTAQYSTQIFSLAVLLSSLFVYNQMGGIDESALDRLSLVTEMTKHIRVRAGGGPEKLGDFTPAFLWLLRDFYLRLEDEGKQVTARDYLETALLPVGGSGASVKSKNEIRDSIKALFPDRDCYTLVRPMNDEAQLVDLDKIDPSLLRPEFRSGVDRLVTHIFSKAEPKRFGTQLMNGPILAGLVEAYVQAINNGAVPTIATAWQGVAEQECRRASDEAEGAYQKSFEEGLALLGKNSSSGGYEEAELDKEHLRSVEVAQAVFDDIAVGDEVIKKAHEKKFKQAVQARFKDVKGRRLAEAAAVVNELLYRANVEISQAARSGQSLDDLQSQLQAFVDKYIATASGPTKWQRLAEFIKDTYGSISSDLVQRSRHESLAVSQASKADAEEAGKRAVAALARAEEAERSHNEAVNESLQLKEALEWKSNEIEELVAKLQRAEGESKVMQRRVVEGAEETEGRIHSIELSYKAQLRQAQLDSDTKINELRALLEAAASREAVLESECKGATMKAQSLELQLTKAGEEVIEWQRRCNGYAQDLAALALERDEAKKVASSKSKELHQLSMENARGKEVAERIQADLHGQAKMRLELQQRLDEMIVEAQSMRHAAMVSGSPLSSRIRVRASEANSVGVDSVGVLDQGEDAAALEESFKRRTITEIKLLLTNAGKEDKVWEMQGRKLPPKKEDWVKLAMEV